MLPDFPKQKVQLLKLWNDYLYNRHLQFLGVWADVPAYKHHEGNSWTTERSGEESEESEYKTIEQVLTIANDEIPYLTPDKLRMKLDLVAEGMAKQASRGFYDTLSTTLEESGQIVDAKGRPLNGDTFLDGLEAVQIDFDKTGQPILPTLVMHPDMAKALDKESKLWDQDAAFKARHELIIQKKRIEWRDRESHRKLVD